MWRRQQRRRARWVVESCGRSNKRSHPTRVKRASRRELAAAPAACARVNRGVRRSTGVHDKKADDRVSCCLPIPQEVKMRRILAIALSIPFACSNALVAAQTVKSPKTVRNEAFKVKAKVDRRVELLIIVARLAGYEEYVSNVVKTYADDIDRHFEKHKQHPAILYAKEMRKSTGLGYNAVMDMAVHLSQPPALAPRVAFTEDIPEGRWGGQKKAEEFVKLLQQFYKDADCESFFKSHADFYSTVEQRFQQLLNKVDFDWYRRFYGEMPQGNFYLYVGLQSGGNYGPEVVFSKTKKDVYAIIATTQADDAGLPIYSERILPTIIHEFSHSFINHLFFAHEKELKTAGEKIYAPVAEKAKLLGYGNWESIVIESLVRAAVIRYRLEHEANPEAAFSQITTERNNGFLWMEEVVTLLGAYENSRENYPTFSSLFPLLVGYLNDLSKRVEREAKIFGQMSPRVVSMSPFANQSQDVNPNITQLTLTFDKPLDTEARYSINRGSRGEAHYPIIKVIGFNETGTALTVEVKLKPDWEYEFLLTGAAFRTKDGYPLQSYAVKFKTGKPAM